MFPRFSYIKPSKVLGKPVIGLPSQGSTETFTAIGDFDTEFEAQACGKYIKTKFCRAMLSILKATQHNPAETWACVPTQDFTPDSDIDWNKTIAEIDRQLYDKYELTPSEVVFIETHFADWKD